jgi:thiamine-phosphate diphosphorylase
MAVVQSAGAGLRAASRATILQVRAPAFGARAVEREAAKLVAESPIPVLVSSRCDVALATAAAGVNLPERDIAVGDARALMGERLIGRSVHSVENAIQAERDGADFVIFGPVWPSASHPRGGAVGVHALAEVARAVAIPVVAIGGVTPERILECLAAGAAGYAAIGLFS